MSPHFRFNSLLYEIKSHFSGHLIQIWTTAFPTEYPGKGLSVDCTFHPEVRSVSLIDSDLTIFLKKNLIFCYFDNTLIYIN